MARDPRVADAIPDVPAPPRRRTGGHVALAVLFALLALNAWAQLAMAALGRSDDPATLLALQLLVGAANAVAAWGSWKAARWAPAAALGACLVVAILIVSLDPILDLGAEARGGLWTGAATVLAGGAGAAWLLRRLGRRSGTP